MTQIERLEQAKAWLEQLIQGRDPITGEPLPDDSAACTNGMNIEFQRCVIIIEQIIAEDGPEPAPNRVNNFRNLSNAVVNRVWAMGRLSQGKNLRTLALPLNSQDPLGRKELRECFAFLEQVLNNSLLAGYFTAKGPFALPQGAVLPISREPVELDRLLEQINALRDADAVRSLTPNILEPYLASQGLLAEAPRRERRKEYLPAPGGEAQGITQATRTGPDGRSYTTLVFSPQAQQYVADHLDDIAAYLADPSRWEPSREGRPPRQLDVLKQAKDYLEQLSCGREPISGKALPGDSAAGKESVRRLLASCARDLHYMILHDEPQLYPDGSVRIAFRFFLKDCVSDSNIKSLDAIAESILGMERLARGCHPDTGASLEPRDPLTQEGLGKCFAFVGQCLRNTYISNLYSAMRPFFLSKEAQGKIYVSQEPVTAVTLAGRINAQLEDSTAVHGITANRILAFLEFNHLIQRDGARYKAVKITAQSEALGIRLKRFESAGRAPYTAPAFDANAQQYVIDHLDDIIRNVSTYYQKKAMYLTEKLEKLEASSHQPSAQPAPSRKPPAQKPSAQGSKASTPLRQLDILKHAYHYLDQLAHSIDPITQAALPADCAAGDDSVQKLIRACRGDLDKMIANDDPEGNGFGHSYERFPYDRAGRTEKLHGIELLSQGRHPDTGALLDPQDPLGQERVRQCFAFAVQALHNAMNAGYFTARVPFSLSPEARVRIPISPKPVDLHTLWKEINAQREDDTAMRALSAKAVLRYLISQGLLQELPTGEIAPTPEGKAMGLACKRPFKANDALSSGLRFGPAAQRYIVDNLDDITVVWRTNPAPSAANPAPTVTSQPTPQDANDRLRSLSDAFRQAGGPEEKQIAALERAKGFLEQLHAYTDPLTGEYLTGDQTARNAGVNDLFSSCLDALKKIIAHDGDNKRRFVYIKKPDVLRRCVQGITRLAQGCHPDTGASLDPKDPLTREGLRGCFAFVAQCLGNALNIGYYSAKAPFSLPPEARRGIVSQESIGMGELLKAINARREDDTASRALVAWTLQKYLISQGVLTRTVDEAGKTRGVPGPRGEELGLTQCERPLSEGGTYIQVLYGPTAQQFIVDHLDDIAALQARQETQQKP